MADFARKRVAPLSTVKKILKDKDAIKADFEAGRPTVNEIFSALRIVRKFSQKNNLIKEIESLRSIENKSGLFSCPDRILDYFSDILFTFSTTFILITKLKSLSVLNLSVRLSVCLSVFLSFYYLSDIQLTF